jgi:hypothetical protein
MKGVGRAACGLRKIGAELPHFSSADARRVPHAALAQA